MNAHLSLSTAVTLTPRRAGLRAGNDAIAEVLVRIQAPDAPAGHVAQRPPQALALVIDRSGSMEGRPLHEARRCADYVVGQLRATDTVSLVQFDNRVRKLWPAVPVGDGVGLRAAIQSITAGGNTNLHGGWKEGADSLAALTACGLRRVILLSDGQANEGLTEPEAIAQQCKEQAALGISTSTYGLGEHFHEELMVAMARASGGNHYYGDTAEDLMEPFQRELELLGNLCLRDLRLSATAPDGVEISLLNDLPALQGGWKLSDLPWGAEAWAVFRVKVPVTSMPAQGQLMNLLRVSIEGQSLEGEPVQLERASLALPVLSPGAYDGLADDELVSRRLSELAAGDALKAMRAAAAAHDWPRVDQLLEEATQRFAGNEWVSSMMETMKTVAGSRSRDRLMKETLYSVGYLNARLAAKEEGVQFSLASESTRPAYLKRKPSQGKGDV